VGVTTVDIDKALLAEAKDALGAATTKAAVDQALREVVMRRRQSAALDGLAALDLELDATKIFHDDKPAH
jgi:Arc/MetJ family transcription regulator